LLITSTTNQCPQFLRQLGDGLDLLTRELDGTTTELGRVGNRYEGIVPGGRSHLGPLHDPSRGALPIAVWEFSLGVHL
jgi:hypothetical protein